MKMDLEFSGRWLPLTTILIPGDTAQAIATLPVPFNINTLTFTLAVSVASLSSLEIWVKGDMAGAFFKIDIGNVMMSGRTDAGSDVTTTPLNESAIIAIDCSHWALVELRAKSTGASVITTTVGGKY